MSYSKFIKRTLLSCIDKLENQREFFSNPESNFTRSRKLSFSDTVKSILLFEGGSLYDELFKYFDYSTETVTPSAFVQQRSKISSAAFEHLFHNFNNVTQDNKKTFHGYKLLAIDGSTIPIRKDSSDCETYISGGPHACGHNAFHLNASFDLLENTYHDIVIQGQAQMNENGAFNTMVDRYNGSKAIFIADRGYESINSFEHVNQSTHKYLIRVKDLNSRTSILKSFDITETGEFDIDVSRTLTRKHTNYIKEHREIYKFMPINQNFDFFNGCKFYDFSCRVVRFKISEDTYESIITNLNRDEFDIEAIKDLYHLRWNIETSFRHLKYSTNLLSFHAKKKEFILQEIYARLILYNLSMRIINHTKIKKKKIKHVYAIDRNIAFHVIREFLKKKSGKKPLCVESIIARVLLPIRPGRRDSRNIRNKQYTSYLYRFD